MQNVKCVHTLTCCTHIFSAQSTLTASFCTLLMRVTYTHGSSSSHVKEGVCCTCIIPLHLAFSSLMSHPFLLFLDGHFETIPDFDVHTFLPYVPVLQAQGMRISARAARSVAAKSALNTVYEPKKFDKITSVDSDTMLIDDTVRCSHSVWILCFARFSWSSRSSNREQRIHASGNRLLDREREKERKEGKRMFCDQCCVVDVKEQSTEQY